MFLGALMATLLGWLPAAEAGEACHSEEAVVSEMRAAGATLGDRLDRREVAPFIAQLAPSPEPQIEAISAAQIWIRQGWALVVFFDAEGCASAVGTGPAEDLMKAAGNAAA